MKITISNLHRDTPKELLHSLLEEFGTVKTINLYEGASTQSPTSYAIIEMGSKSEAYSVVLYLNGDILNGKPLSVECLKVSGNMDNRLKKS